MICDICGGTLVMQPGATAKCNCCGMDYSTESLKEKFAASQNSGISTNYDNKYVQNTSDMAIGTEQVITPDPIEEVLNQISVKRYLSENEQLLSRFFHQAALANKMMEVKKIWNELGLDSIHEYQEFYKVIEDKAEFERLYGTSFGSISDFLDEWREELDIALEDEINEGESVSVETESDFIDVVCPSCGHELSYFKWQITNDSEFICSYCGESIVFQ